MPEESEQFDDIALLEPEKGFEDVDYRDEELDATHEHEPENAEDDTDPELKMLANEVGGEAEQWELHEQGPRGHFDGKEIFDQNGVSITEQIRATGDPALIDQHQAIIDQWNSGGESAILLPSATIQEDDRSVTYTTQLILLPGNVVTHRTHRYEVAHAKEEQEERTEEEPNSREFPSVSWDETFEPVAAHDDEEAYEQIALTAEYAIGAGADEERSEQSVEQKFVAPFIAQTNHVELSSPVTHTAVSPQETFAYAAYAPEIRSSKISPAVSSETKEVLEHHANTAHDRVVESPLRSEQRLEVAAIPEAVHEPERISEDKTSELQAALPVFDSAMIAVAPIEHDVPVVAPVHEQITIQEALYQLVIEQEARLAPVVSEHKSETAIAQPDRVEHVRPRNTVQASSEKPRTIMEALNPRIARISEALRDRFLGHRSRENVAHQPVKLDRETPPRIEKPATTIAPERKAPRQETEKIIPIKSALAETIRMSDEDTHEEASTRDETVHESAHVIETPTFDRVREALGLPKVHDRAATTREDASIRALRGQSPFGAGRPGAGRVVRTHSDDQTITMVRNAA